MTAVAGPVNGSGGRGGSSGGAGEALDGAVRAALNPLVAWLVTTTGGILLFLYLLRRGTRFDDDRPRDLVFAPAVAALLAGQNPLSAAPPLTAHDPPPVGPVAAAASPKRTRKSTSKAATRPTGTIQATTPAAGAGGAAVAAKAKRGSRSSKAAEKTAKKGVERATISYRRVRISSEPDDVRSVELGRLDRGDEVEILDSHEGFLRVRTTPGLEGWIQRHTIVP